MFFFNDTATTEIYTLALHDALPICCREAGANATACQGDMAVESDVLRVFEEATSSLGRLSHVVNNAGITGRSSRLEAADRKSTRLNSSHANISYAVFCLKNKTSYYA